MCGIVGLFGNGVSSARLEQMIATQLHRGPDDHSLFVSPSRLGGLGHTRLSIIDLTHAGRQPFSDPEGRFWITFNGEIYNYIELRLELQSTYQFRTRTDTEVLLAAYLKWGEDCLDRLIGMFSFLVWDDKNQTVFGARDRFGVKPLYYHFSRGTLIVASEIKALHAGGVDRTPNTTTWCAYLCDGAYDHTTETFWQDINSVPPGGTITWNAASSPKISIWYNLETRIQEAGIDNRQSAEVESELLSILDDSVKLRFRSDVPVGVCLSGGFDSSLLLALIDRSTNSAKRLHTFTFVCGDDQYDERPWVELMLKTSSHVPHFNLLDIESVPSLASAVQKYQDEPFGGIPTLAMAKVHECARALGVVVLLDGNGLDEAWAGYDYYRSKTIGTTPLIQGTRDPITRPQCVDESLRRLAPLNHTPLPQTDNLTALQIRDLRFTKIPRAMRFADRVSMMYSRELREPFLDHRLVELGIRQPRDRKIQGDTGKWLPRQLGQRLLPAGLNASPKRAVQTPQREWLRGGLRDWAQTCIHAALNGRASGWLKPAEVNHVWQQYLAGKSDNSFYIWQWISLGLMNEQ